MENIRKFAILDKNLCTEDGEVAPMMKVKRKYMNAAYQETIEALYRGD